MMDYTPTLAREQGAPLHHQIFLVLRDAISSGRYQPRELLPREDALAAMFGVSRITVRRALDTLARLNLIERRPGRGTFVAQKMEPTISMPLTSIMDQIILVGETSSVKVVEFGMAVPSPDIGEIFGLVPTAKLQRAVRVRTRDNCPLFHLITYVSRQVGDTITRADMEQKPLFELIRRAGVVIASGHQVVTATLAAPPVAQRLEVKIGAPLLRIVRILNDASNRPVEYMDMLCSPERHHLRQTLESDDLRVINNNSYDEP